MISRAGARIHPATTHRERAYFVPMKCAQTLRLPVLLHASFCASVRLLCPRTAAMLHPIGIAEGGYGDRNISEHRNPRAA